MGNLIACGNIDLFHSPNRTIPQLVKCKDPTVFSIQLSGFFHTAVLQQIDSNGFAIVGIVAVGPYLADGQLFGLEGFQQEGDIHFAHTVCVFVAQFNGDDQFHQKLDGIAGGNRTQTDEGIQRAGGQCAGHCTGTFGFIAETCCGSFVQQLLAVVHAHGQLVQEIGHGRDGLIPFPFHIALILTVCVFRSLIIGQRVIDFVVRDEFHIQVYIVRVLGFVAEDDGLEAAVTGHQVFKVAEQVVFRVADAFPVAPAIVAAFGSDIIGAFPVVDNFGISKAGHHAGAQHRNNSHEDRNQFQKMLHSSPPTVKVSSKFSEITV